MSRDLGAEILECQRSRSDLLKWKLILVAGVAAAGLGFAPGQNKQPLLLALIPFVCVYVDLLCSHQWLQIHVIAAFLREKHDDYESFVQRIRQNNVKPFALEKWALYGTTILLCIGTAIVGHVLLGAAVELKLKAPWILGAVFLGLVLSFATILYNEYNRYEKAKKYALYVSTVLLWLATAALVSSKLCGSIKQERELRLILGAAAAGLALSFVTMGYFYHCLNKVRVSTAKTSPAAPVG